jgi:hypothetical protein
MRQASGGKRSIERIEKNTDELLQKNRQLIEKWNAQYRQDFESIRSQRTKRAAQTEIVSEGTLRCS